MALYGCPSCAVKGKALSAWDLENRIRSPDPEVDSRRRIWRHRAIPLGTFGQSRYQTTSRL